LSPQHTSIYFFAFGLLLDSLSWASIQISGVYWWLLFVPSSVLNYFIPRPFVSRFGSPTFDGQRKRTEAKTVTDLVFGRQRRRNASRLNYPHLSISLSILENNGRGSAADCLSTALLPGTRGNFGCDSGGKHVRERSSSAGVLTEGECFTRKKAIAPGCRSTAQVGMRNRTCRDLSG
jgi:hypothetical protein